MEKMFYLRNIGSITGEECTKLQNSRVFVAGCGGLGGNLIIHLLRIGIGHITAVDGDVFEPTNMNRQMFCTTETLSRPKAIAAQEYAALINPSIDFNGMHTYLNDENSDSLISGHDVVIDALDNIESRRILALACDRAGIPLVYGGICGWVSQVSVFSPGTAACKMGYIYPHNTKINDSSCLSFTPAFCASIQCSEAVKVLLGKPSELNGKLLYVDLLTSEWELFPLF